MRLKVQLGWAGWWRLVVVGGWRLVAAGSSRQLVVGGWWRLAVGGSWRLAVGDPLGRSLRVVLNKKNNWFLKDHPASLGIRLHLLSVRGAPQSAVCACVCVRACVCVCVNCGYHPHRDPPQRFSLPTYGTLLPTNHRQPPPIATNRHQPPVANCQPPTANRHQPWLKTGSARGLFWEICVTEHLSFFPLRTALQ